MKEAVRRLVHQYSNILIDPAATSMDLIPSMIDERIKGFFRYTYESN